MKAHEKKKAYRQSCARKLRADLIPDPRTGNWGASDHSGAPLTTQLHLKYGCHPFARRAGK